MLFVQPQIRHSQVTLMVKKTPTKAGDVRDMGLIPGLGDSLQDDGTATTPIFLPGQRSQAGYGQYDPKELNTTEAT